jgi:hypothetical protein
MVTIFFPEETKYRETTNQKAEQKLMSIDRFWEPWAFCYPTIRPASLPLCSSLASSIAA